MGEEYPGRTSVIMKRVLILVEGLTEERFTKDILQPHLLPFGITIQPKIVMTKRLKSGRQFKGGVSNFGKLEQDLRRLIYDTNAVLITTLLDFYGFPRDFEGWNRVINCRPELRVKQLEEAFEERIGHRRFRAYLMMHEFESMLFSDPLLIAKTMNCPNEETKLQEIKRRASGPEKINEGNDTHPSAHLMTIFSDYQKPLHGPLIVNRIGLNRVRSECSHFNDWLSDLEALAE